MTDPFAKPSGDQPPPVAPPAQPSTPVYGAPHYGAPPPPYGQPQHQPYGAPLAGPARNGFGVAALVLGIASIVLVWTVLGGVVLGGLAVVFGILGRRRAKRQEATNGGVALAGSITGGIGFLLGAGLLVFAIVVVQSDAYKTYRDCTDAADGSASAEQQCTDTFLHDYFGLRVDR